MQHQNLDLGRLAWQKMSLVCVIVSSFMYTETSCLHSWIQRPVAFIHVYKNWLPYCRVWGIKGILLSAWHGFWETCHAWPCSSSLIQCCSRRPKKKCIRWGAVYQVWCCVPGVVQFTVVVDLVRQTRHGAVCCIVYASGRRGACSSSCFSIHVLYLGAWWHR